MDKDLMFSSANQAWATRWATFNSIQKQLGRQYNLDPCCLKETAKCDNFITPEEDMFTVKNPLEYFEKESQIQMFVNPEYGRNQRKFVEHIANWCGYDNVIADVLIPTRTDTGLFHDVILPKATAIYFIKGRVTFGNDEYWEWLWGQEFVEGSGGVMKKNSLYKKYGKMNPAPFPSMVVSFGGKLDNSVVKYNTLVLDKG